MDIFVLNCGAGCGSKFNFQHWFQNSQRCPECDSNRCYAEYDGASQKLKKNLFKNSSPRKGLWRYFDLLPINYPENIVTTGEGDVAIDRWSFLENIAIDHGIRCQVFAHRQDNNNATGTFKDLAASLVASGFLENNIRKSVVASTGNIGVAYTRYISASKGEICIFIPQKSSKANEAEISKFGQRVFRIIGD